MRIWELIGEKLSVTVVHGDLIRVVESQEQIATNKLVDNLEEQQQLEALLEKSKPIFAEYSEKLHYLLATPFRYPPLVHGSRFATRFQSSLFYASKKISTAFAETAYYRFYFWKGMEVPPPGAKFLTEHTVFKASYYSEKGLKLQNPSFAEFEQSLTDPAYYHITQQLGTDMREHDIEVFEYVSARDVERNINTALFYPSALVSKKPKEQQQWLCETTAEKVSFSAKHGKLYVYPLTSYLVNGEFPSPAH